MKRAVEFIIPKGDFKGKYLTNLNVSLSLLCLFQGWLRKSIDDSTEDIGGYFPNYFFYWSHSIGSNNVNIVIYPVLSTHSVISVCKISTHSVISVCKIYASNMNYVVYWSDVYLQVYLQGELQGTLRQFVQTLRRNCRTGRCGFNRNIFNYGTISTIFNYSNLLWFFIVLNSYSCEPWSKILQTSGSFVCTFSFMFMSHSVCSVSILYAFISTACSVSSTYMSNRLSISALCLFSSYFYALGLHTRSYTRTYSYLEHLVYLVYLVYRKLYHKLYSSRLILTSKNQLNVSNAHSGLRLLLILCGDVELNPGPFLNNKKLLLLTQNCRGLNSFYKLKHLIHNKNKIVKNELFVLALQETYLINDSTINWCGKYILSKAESTHSAGCITFIPDTVSC